MRYHFTPTKIGVIKLSDNTRFRGGRGGLVPSCVAGGDATWRSHCGNQASSLKKLNMINVSYDSIILLLGIHSRKTQIRDVFTQRFAHKCS